MVTTMTGGKGPDIKEKNKTFFPTAIKLEGGGV